MSILQLSVSFLAGLLATLSPCVLPVLPFVTAASLGKNKWAPVALALGLLLAFVGTTLLITISGEFLGLSQEFLKKGAGILLSASGLLFLIPALQEALADLLSRLTQRIGNQFPKNSIEHSITQEFFSGVLLGIIWSPCSGPSLGVALGLATQAGGVAPAAILLSAFGIGAVIPILVFSYGAKSFAKRIQSQGTKILWIKKLVGLSMLVFGVLIYTNLDKGMEAYFNQLLPESYIQFTTKF